jgi:hypothetical protein
VVGSCDDRGIDACKDVRHIRRDGRSDSELARDPIGAFGNWVYECDDIDVGTRQRSRDMGLTCDLSGADDA